MQGQISGGFEPLQFCWWPIYHISALQCFGSHEGGSLNCPQTAPGWRLFALILQEATQAAGFRRTRAKLLNLLVNNSESSAEIRRSSVSNPVFLKGCMSWDLEGAGCVLSDE